MTKPTLKAVIADLEKTRQKYIKKFGVEPKIWHTSSEDGVITLDLVDKVKKTDYGHTASRDRMMEEVKTKLPDF